MQTSWGGVIWAAGWGLEVGVASLGIGMFVCLGYRIAQTLVTGAQCQTILTLQHSKLKGAVHPRPESFTPKPRPPTPTSPKLQAEGRRDLLPNPQTWNPTTHPKANQPGESVGNFFSRHWQKSIHRQTLAPESNNVKK